MFKSPFKREANSKMNIALIDNQVVSVVDRNVVFVFAAIFMLIVFVSLYAQWQNQKKIERVVALQCAQRRRLEQFVSLESRKFAQIDTLYLERAFPLWVRARRAELDTYARLRRELGEEQCRATP